MNLKRTESGKSESLWPKIMLSHDIADSALSTQSF